MLYKKLKNNIIAKREYQKFLNKEQDINENLSDKDF